MKHFLVPMLFLLVAGACQKVDEPSVREETYQLHKATFNPTSGTATIRELAPGKLEFIIELKHTFEGLDHPAHLHFGTISEVGELACKLNPVIGATGKSVTVLDHITLSNGEVLGYDLLQEMNGSIKIHMNDNYFSKFVISYGNIGQNENYAFEGVSTCTGH